MAFTAQEEARVLHFLWYPNWISLAQAIQLGYPAATQPLFLVRDGFNRLAPGGEQAVRADLCELEDIERQMSTARRRLRATQVGEVKLNAAELGALKSEYIFWQRKLADDFGVPVNPYAAQSYYGMGGAPSLNVRVIPNG